MHSHCRPQRSGFTLIEVLCVCIILAIAARITIPFITNGYADVKLSAAARSFMADVYYAQSLAVTKQQNVFIVFTPATSTTGGSYTIKSGATLTSAVQEKNPTDFLDYIQYLGTCANSTQQAAQRPTFADAKLGTLPTGFTVLGFDLMGEPLNADGSVMATSPSGSSSSSLDLLLNSPDGKMKVTLSIQLYTGELSVSKVGG